MFSSDFPSLLGYRQKYQEGGQVEEPSYLANLISDYLRGSQLVDTYGAPQASLAIGEIRGEGLPRTAESAGLPGGMTNEDLAAIDRYAQGAVYNKLMQQQPPILGELGLLGGVAGSVFNEVSKAKTQADSPLGQILGYILAPGIPTQQEISKAFGEDQFTPGEGSSKASLRNILNFIGGSFFPPHDNEREPIQRDERFEGPMGPATFVRG